MKRMELHNVQKEIQLTEVAFHMKEIQLMKVYTVMLPFRFGIEGPVYLTPKGEKGEDWLVDEEHQRVTKADAGISYSVLQAVRIHMEVVERQPNRPKLELTLI